MIDSVNYFYSLLYFYIIYTVFSIFFILARFNLIFIISHILQKCFSASLFQISTRYMGNIFCFMFLQNISNFLFHVDMINFTILFFISFPFTQYTHFVTEVFLLFQLDYKFNFYNRRDFQKMIFISLFQISFRHLINIFWHRFL